MLARPLLLALLAGTSLAPIAARAEACADTVEITVDRMGGLDDELLRLADMVGATPLKASRLIRRGGPRREVVCASAPATTPFERFDAELASTDRTVEAGALPLRLGTVWNSGYPSGDNDGLLWAGRGVSQLLSGGATVRAGVLSLTLAPEVSWSENRWFATRPNGHAGPQRFANPYYPGNIDLPQRFGAGPFSAWGPGQSSLRLEGFGVAAGLSSENYWFGPGIRNAILMSDTGPGFPHAFIGTARPVDVWIGDVEALVLWGRLERSKYAYFENHPLFEALMLTYAPRWTPGLSLGLGRLSLKEWKNLQLADAFAFFKSPAIGDEAVNAGDNRLVSVFFRWVFPESGAEVYGEWAREDSERNIYGFIHDPDHSQAYQVGLAKAFRVGSGLLRANVELIQLQNRRDPMNYRRVPVYYVHANGVDFTNRGQLLGAGVGPGGSSQTLAIDWFHRGGRVGGYFERVLRNDEYYWEHIDATDPGARDVELRLGARQVLEVGRVEVAWDLSYARRWQRDFLDFEKNLRAMLELRVPLGGGTRARVAATSAASGR